MNKIYHFFGKPIFSTYKFWVGLILILTIIACAQQLLLFYYGGDPSRINGGSNFVNNYTIFRNVFWNAVNNSGLYEEYPDIHYDVNHYGPIFSLVIAPFAILPKYIGLILWAVVVNQLLVLSIWKLELSNRQKALILLIPINLFFVCIQDNQSNALVAALVIAAFLAVQKEKIWLATFFIMLGFLIKLYVIVGVVFFLFTSKKKSFIISIISWAIILFVLPMIFFGYEFIIQSYIDWYFELVVKTGTNVLSSYQNISVQGIFYKIGYLFIGNSITEVSSLYILIPVCIILSIALLNIKQYKNIHYQYNALALMLLCINLFSSGTETSGYIIGATGFSIWFIIKKYKTRIDKIIFWFAFIFSVIAPSDIFPKFIYSNYMQPYSLIAFPFFIVWLKIIYEQLTMNRACSKLYHLRG